MSDLWSELVSSAGIPEVKLNPFWIAERKVPNQLTLRRFAA